MPCPCVTDARLRNESLQQRMHVHTACMLCEFVKGEKIIRQCVHAWTPCGGPVLGAGGEPNKTDIDKSLFTNLYLKRVPVPFPFASCIRT